MAYDVGMTKPTARSRIATPTACSCDRRHVVGYLRCSTLEQVDSGAGLAAQETAITSEATRQDWHVVALIQDAGVSGGQADRAGLTEALAMIEGGQAGTLVVAKLDRLTRSLPHFADTMERARRKGWSLVALDLGIDLSTPAGEFLASVMASAAQWERRIIGQRTKDAMAEKRRDGVWLSRPRADLDPATVERILAERADGRSFPMIAARLTDDSVPTARGGARWYASTIRDVVLRHGAAVAA